MGAADPSSGTASIHEVIRGLGHLLRHGWKPLRTIVIASWDAEEVNTASNICLEFWLINLKSMALLEAQNGAKTLKIGSMITLLHTLT